jgi:hypothetical protein
MITEWFIGLFNSIIQWVIDLFGDAEPPEWMTGIGGFLAELFARASGLGAWVPFALVGIVGGTVLTTWGVLWLVKLFRWGYGLTPFSGGS